MVYNAVLMEHMWYIRSSRRRIEMWKEERMKKVEADWVSRDLDSELWCIAVMVRAGGIIVY